MSDAGIPFLQATCWHCLKMSDYAGRDVQVNVGCATLFGSNRDGPWQFGHMTTAVVVMGTSRRLLAFRLADFGRGTSGWELTPSKTIIQSTIVIGLIVLPVFWGMLKPFAGASALLWMNARTVHKAKIRASLPLWGTRLSLYSAEMASVTRHAWSLARAECTSQDAMHKPSDHPQ